MRASACFHHPRAARPGIVRPCTANRWPPAYDSCCFCCGGDGKRVRRLTTTSAYDHDQRFGDCHCFVVESHVEERSDSGGGVPVTLRALNYCGAGLRGVGLQTHLMGRALGEPCLTRAGRGWVVASATVGSTSPPRLISPARLCSRQGRGRRPRTGRGSSGRRRALDMTCAAPPGISQATEASSTLFSSVCRCERRLLSEGRHSRASPRRSSVVWQRRP